MDTAPCPVFENPVTGERVVVLTDARVHPEQVLVSHLFIRSGGRVAAAHVHPTVDERFLVLSGEVGFLLDDGKRTLRAGEGASVRAGVVHDWWQVGDSEAQVLVEVIPGVRFAEMVGSMFGLARDGKVTIPPLAALGRRRGRKPMYPEYLAAGPTEAPDPAALAQLTVGGRLRPFAE